jgi:carbon storage regulator
MLILTLRIGRSIKIGENITVTVVRVQDGQVRLGINAPREIPVHREEVAERIRQEREQRSDSQYQGRVNRR